MEVRGIPHHANRTHVPTQVAKLSTMLQHQPPVRPMLIREMSCCSRDWKFGRKSCDIVQPHVVYADVKAYRNHTSFVNESSWATAVGETRSGHGWSVFIRRESRRLGDQVSLLAKKTATAEALARLGVGPKRKNGDC